MKRFVKNNLLGFILGAIVFGSIGVYATIKIQSSEIGYKDGTVEEAIDDLYSKASGGLKLCKFIDGTYGAKGNVGSKYECKLGDGETRYFYILTVNSDNTVDMIMDRNITQGTSEVKINFDDAQQYFNSGTGLSLKNYWKNIVRVSLPTPEAIAKARNYSNWTKDVNKWFCLDSLNYMNHSPWCNSSPNSNWLFDYTNSCIDYGCLHSLTNDAAMGYWTNSVASNQNGHAWNINNIGSLNYDIKTSTNFGIRPVITVLKSSLYE